MPTIVALSGFEPKVVKAIDASMDLNETTRKVHRFLSIIEQQKPDLIPVAAQMLESLSDNLRQALVEHGIDPTPRMPVEIDQKEKRDFIDAWIRYHPQSNREEAERAYERVKSEEIQGQPVPPQ